MVRLSRREFHTISEFIEELYAAPTLDAYASRVVHGVPRIIRSDVCTFNEFNPRRRRVHWIATAAEMPDGRTIFARHMHEHPLIKMWNPAIRHDQAVKLSDFVGRRQWHDRGVYTEFYGPQKIEHQ